MKTESSIISSYKESHMTSTFYPVVSQKTAGSTKTAAQRWKNNSSLPFKGKGQIIFQTSDQPTKESKED